MKRTISVIVRNSTGALAMISDRVAIDCDQDFAGVDALVDAQQGKGARAVLVLMEDDSLCRHWVLPT